MSLGVIFDACEPREEVVRGDLRDEMFAARLRDVMENRADPIYQEAKRWTPPTASTTVTSRPGLSGGELAYQLGRRVGYDLLRKSDEDLVAPGTGVLEKLVGDRPALYTPQEAERLGVRIKGVEQAPQECPLCRRAPCVCGEDLPPDPAKKRLRAQAEGPPAQAFQSIADQFHDAGASKIARLIVRCEGVGKEGAADSRALGLAIPQLGKGAYHLDHTRGPSSERARTRRGSA